MLEHSSDNLSRAVLQTVAYSDIFDYPLTAHEIHRYLIGVEASLEEVARTVEDEEIFTRTGDYFTLPGREEIVNIRMNREVRSRELLSQAMKYGRMLGALPYIRMVALTGSLAVMNVSGNQDFDYMLVTVPGRVWTARAFALAINRLASVRGYTLCPNLIISETALEWNVHDLYSAREVCQMKLIKGKDVYMRLMKVNAWIRDFLPNAFNANSMNATNKAQNSLVRGIRVERFQHLLETLLPGSLGDRFENWEMNRKIARFSKQAGFGEETIFNTEICQGNFHHHRQWTHEAFEERLSALAAVLGGEVALTQLSRTAIGAHRL
jgi:hypothetical protein